MTLKTSDAAPDFTLLNQDEQEVSLSSFAGKKVIVYFYPAASTPGCTTQACELRDNINSLTSGGYVVLGISPDKPGKLKKFKDKEGLNFDLLSDEDNAIQQEFVLHSWWTRRATSPTPFTTSRPRVTSTCSGLNWASSHAVARAPRLP